MVCARASAPHGSAPQPPLPARTCGPSGGWSVLKQCREASQRQRNVNDVMTGSLLLLPHGISVLPPPLTLPYSTTVPSLLPLCTFFPPSLHLLPVITFRSHCCYFFFFSLSQCNTSSSSNYCLLSVMFITFYYSISISLSLSLLFLTIFHRLPCFLS